MVVLLWDGGNTVISLNSFLVTRPYSKHIYQERTMADMEKYHRFKSAERYFVFNEGLIVATFMNENMSSCSSEEHVPHS